MKGALCRLVEESQTHHFSIYKINEVEIHNVNKLFSAVKKVPRPQVEDRKVAGSATSKQSKTA